MSRFQPRQIIGLGVNGDLRWAVRVDGLLPSGWYECIVINGQWEMRFNPSTGEVRYNGQTTRDLEVLFEDQLPNHLLQAHYSEVMQYMSQYMYKPTQAPMINPKINKALLLC